MDIKNNKRPVLIPGIFLTASLSSTVTALAQVGTMDYESAATFPVPVGGGMFLVALGALLGAVALWKISRSGISANKVAAAFLTMGAAVFSLSGGHIIQQAYAPPTALSNPDGGTVDVYPGYQEYINTSNSLLKISAINLDSCEQAPAAQGTNVKNKGAQTVQAVDPYPECVPGETVLHSNDICTTNAPACSNRITQRAGYFWVRADYNAPAEDHGSICAEFGLVATEQYVSLTWDATLLEALANDFGYTSVGDYADAATSMWCWDADGHAPAGTCGTHNFGPEYTNYGSYDQGATGMRPVFTCVNPIP